MDQIGPFPRASSRPGPLPQPSYSAAFSLAVHQGSGAVL